MLKCTLSGTSAKTLAKAIHVLAKFGTHLFVEGLRGELQLRTVNISKSAIATIKFKRSFFEKYSVSDEETYCKISFKTCMTVFRNMKQVEQCEMNIIPEESKMFIQFKSFKLETVKDAYISILDEENINAVFATDTVNCIIGSHKLFTDLVANFNLSEEEVTFEVKKDKLFAKNYIEGSQVYEKFMRTQLRLSAMEFDSYRVQTETSVTFSLKEFRAVLLFAESLNEHVTLNFDESGSPIFINVSKMDDVDCLLVMSTLSYEDVSFYESCRRSDDINEHTSISSSTSKRKLQNSRNTRSNTTKVPRNMNSGSTQSVTSVIFPFNSEATSNTNSEITIPRGVIESGDESTPSMVFTNNNRPSVSKGQQQQNESAITFRSSEEMDIDDFVIQQSPTRDTEWHKVRTIFARCFESTYVPEKPAPGSPHYVQNSDTED